MRPLVIVGPSGVGKGTLIAKIQEGFAGALLHNGTWDGKHALRGSISTVILTKYYTSQCADNSVFWILSRVSRVVFFISALFHIFCQTPKRLLLSCVSINRSTIDPWTRQDALASRYLTPRGNQDLERLAKKTWAPQIRCLLMCKNRNVRMMTYIYIYIFNCAYIYIWYIHKYDI